MLISLVLLVFFMLMQGMFAGMETGMISVRRPRIEHAHENGSRAAPSAKYPRKAPACCPAW